MTILWHAALAIFAAGGGFTLRDLLQRPPGRCARCAEVDARENAQPTGSASVRPSASASALLNVNGLLARWQRGGFPDGAGLAIALLALDAAAYERGRVDLLDQVGIVPLDQAAVVAADTSAAS